MNHAGSKVTGGRRGMGGTATNSPCLLLWGLQAEPKYNPQKQVIIIGLNWPLTHRPENGSTLLTNQAFKQGVCCPALFSLLAAQGHRLSNKESRFIRAQSVVQETVSRCLLLAVRVWREHGHLVARDGKKKRDPANMAFPAGSVERQPIFYIFIYYSVRGEMCSWAQTPNHT